jgi:hypothetical protein
MRCSRPRCTKPTTQSEKEGWKSFGSLSFPRLVTITVAQLTALGGIIGHDCEFVGAFVWIGSYPSFDRRCTFPPGRLSCRPNHCWSASSASARGAGFGIPGSRHPAPREPSRTCIDAALALDELDRLSLIIRVAGYALRFFVGAPSDTPSLDAC